MKIFAEADEAANRVEELIDLAQHSDDVVNCRDAVPFVTLTAVRNDFDHGNDRL
ncbi:MAG: hypothetical protein ACK4QP_21340 [Pseudorhizobium sp.]